jgi:hypothetical protein
MESRLIAASDCLILRVRGFRFQQIWRQAEAIEKPLIA